MINPNPAGATIVVPAKTNAWINTQGKVVYSSDINYDPNKDPNSQQPDWTKLQPKP